MGLRKAPYWLANYTFDILLFLTPLILLFILIFVINGAQFLRDVAGYLALALILFCFAFISYSYMFSFAFQKANTSFRLFPIFNFILFFIIPQIPQIVARDSFVAQYISPLASPFVALSSCFYTNEFYTIPSTYQNN